MPVPLVVTAVGVEERFQRLRAGVADHDHHVVGQDGGYHPVAILLTAVPATGSETSLVVRERGQAGAVEDQDGYWRRIDMADDEPGLVAVPQRPHGSPLHGELHVGARRAVDL